MKYFFSLLAILFCCTASFSQDKIFKRNGQVTSAKVTEVGIAEIKYKLPGSDGSVIYVLDKNQVSKIVFEDGHSDKFVTDLKDTSNYTGQLRKAIKINFLSPLYGYTEFSFEKSTGIGKSYEVSFGIIGLGKNSQLDFAYYGNNIINTKRNQFGLFASAGYKFNKWPDFIFGKTRFTHLMQGAYVKPVFYLGNYKENVYSYKNNNEYVLGKQHVTFGALQIEFGKQWVFSEKFLIDGYWGLGYGADNKKENLSQYQNSNNSTSAFNYANSRLGNSPGFSFTFGLRAGMLIK